MAVRKITVVDVKENVCRQLHDTKYLIQQKTTMNNATASPKLSIKQQFLIY